MLWRTIDFSKGLFKKKGKGALLSSKHKIIQLGIGSYKNKKLRGKCLSIREIEQMRSYEFDFSLSFLRTAESIWNAI